MASIEIEFTLHNESIKLCREEVKERMNMRYEAVIKLSSLF